MKVKLTVFFFRPTNVLYLSIHSNNFSTYTRLEEKIIRMLVASFFAYFIQASVGLTTADKLDNTIFHMLVSNCLSDGFKCS